MKTITIVGGGLAGLSLGLGLRQRGVPVTIWEANEYPRHRVCGEFVSGRGLETLRRLDLFEAFVQAGAVEARNAVFFHGSRRSIVFQLPARALCLSRFAMDAMLARRFESAGGLLRQRERWSQSFGQGIVRATGRRLKSSAVGSRWFGLKVHARGAPLQADLEMHFGPDHYVGLCRLAHDVTNVCGIFRKPGAHGAAQFARRELLGGLTDTPLRRWIAEATLDESSFCSVAGLSLWPQYARDQEDCSIGDALTMIPPVTGNGMSMAFEAAELAIEPLVAFSCDEMSWAEARQTIGRGCDRLFADRLAWARFMHGAMFIRSLQSPLARVLFANNWLWRFLFCRTRSHPSYRRVSRIGYKPGQAA